MASREDVVTWIAELYAQGASFARVPRMVARRFGLAVEDADDAIQEAFQKCLRKPPSAATTLDEFTQYCRRVIVNDLKRRARREARYELFGDTTHEQLVPPADRRTEAMHECLKTLPTETRDLVTAHYFDEATLDELAERFLPPDQRTANARRLVIRRQLRTALQVFRHELLTRFPDIDWPEPAD